MYFSRDSSIFILFFFLLMNCGKSKVEKPFSSESGAKIQIENIFFSGIALDRYKVLTHLPSIQKAQLIEVDFQNSTLPQLAQIQFTTLQGTYHTQTTCKPIQTSPDGSTETLMCTVTFVNKQYYSAVARNKTDFSLRIFRKLDLSGKEAKIKGLSFDQPSNYVFLNYKNPNNHLIDYENIQSDDIENFEPLKIGLIKNRIKVDLIYSELAKQKSVSCSSNEAYQTCVYTVVSGDKKTTKTYHIQFWYFPELQNILSNVEHLQLLYAPAALQSLQPDGKIDIQAVYFPELADLKIVARPTHQIIRDEKTKTFSLVFQNYNEQEIKYHLAFKSIVKIKDISLDGKNNANWTNAMATWLSGKENEIQLKLDENQAYPKNITLDFSSDIWQIKKIETIALSILNNPNELDQIIHDKTENGLLVPAYTQSPRRKIQVENSVTQELLVYYLSFQATEVKIESFTIDPILLPIFSQKPQNWKPEEIIYIETLKMPKKEEISYQLKGLNYSSSLSIDNAKRQVILEIQQNDGQKFKYILQFQTLTIISQKANEKYLKSGENIIGEYDQKNATFKTFLDLKNDLFETITLEDEEYAKVEQILNLSQKNTLSG
jgi:hypothetical protein